MAAAIAFSSPRRLDIAGSSAAETDMPNRLTGSTDRFWAYVNAATEPAMRNDAIHASTYALICTTPRPTKTGPKFRTISRTCGELRLNARRRRPSTRSTTGTCTSICSALPTTDPHASHTASSGNVARPSEPDERCDHRNVPNHRRRVGEKELSVAVQNSKAPGGHHEQSGTGEQHAHERHREIALRPREASGDEVHEYGRREHANQHESRHDEGEDREHRARYPRRLFAIVVRNERRVDRNERRRQHALAKQILEEVGDSERRTKCVGFVGNPEVKAEHSLAHESDDSAEQDAREHQCGVP